LAKELGLTTLEVIFLAVCETYPEEIRDAVNIRAIGQDLHRGKIPTFLSSYCGKKLAELNLAGLA